MDTGGAHPNSDVNTILWDATEKKRISIRPFFTETADNGPTMKAMLQSRDRLAEGREEEARCVARPRRPNGTRTSSQGCSRSAR